VQEGERGLSGEIREPAGNLTTINPERLEMKESKVTKEEVELPTRKLEGQGTADVDNRLISKKTSNLAGELKNGVTGRKREWEPKRRRATRNGGGG